MMSYSSQRQNEMPIMAVNLRLFFKLFALLELIIFLFDGCRLGGD